MDFEQLDQLTQDRLKFLDNNYSPLIDYHLNKEEKIYLGNKENRVCRFCGRDSTATTFRNIAHALPEFIGNKRLFAYYECDACNSKFSGTLENDMANYTKLWHTLAQIKGKKGIPTTVSNQKKSRIEVGKDAVNIQEHEGDAISTTDEKKRTITLEAARGAFTPVAVYKCLTKMALTIMPEEELSNFQVALDWINETNHESSSINPASLYALLSTAPGPHPLGFLSCMLFKRKENALTKVPYMLFLVAYSNFIWQIHLPFTPKDDELTGQRVEFVFIPTPIDMIEGAQTISRQRIDLNGKQLVKGEKARMTMGYEAKIQVDLTEGVSEAAD